MKRAVLLLLALLRAGCAASVTERPAPGLPPGHALPQLQPGNPAELPLADRLGADPAFRPLLEAALAASPDLEAAAARIAEARAGRNAAAAALAPRLDGSAQVTRSRTSLDQFGFALPPGEQFERDRTLFAPSLDLSWEADLFGRLAASRRASGLRLDAASADASAVRLALGRDVARSLVAIRALDLRGAATSRAAEAARTVARLNGVRVASGLASAADLASAESDLASAEAAIAPLQAARDAEVAALVRLTGLPVDAILGLLLPLRPLPEAWAIPAIPAETLQRRPDVAAAHARLRAADAEVAAAVAARYPRLTLAGSVGFLASAASGLFTAEALAASLGGGLSGPILDFGRAAAEAERARARSAGAVADYRSAVLGAIAEVETLLSATRAGRRQSFALGEAVARLERSAQLARAQFAAGLVRRDVVAEAERRLAIAEDARIAAEAGALEAAVRLEAAVGGSLASSQPR